MTTVDDGELGYVSAAGVAHEVAALLPGLTVVTRTDPIPVPVDAPAVVVFDDRPPVERAADVCWQLLFATNEDGRLRTRPVEVEHRGVRPEQVLHHGPRVPSPFLYAARPNPAKRDCFVRIVLDDRYACVQGMTWPAGPDNWGKTGPPEWLPYPGVWDDAGIHAFRTSLVDTVWDLLVLLAALHKRHDDIEHAGRLPGTNPI